MRRYLLLALPVLASGCALPPAVVVASYTADGISYLASGKSLEDHGLSAVTNEDCALHRVLMEEPICSDFKPADATSSAGSPRASPAIVPKQSPVSPGSVPAAPPVASTPRTEIAVAQRPPLPRAPAPVANIGPRRYLVLGSFSTHENAARFAKQLEETNLAVVSVRLQGRTLYRVVAGPLTVTRVADLRARLPGGIAGQTWEVASLTPG